MLPPSGQRGVLIAAPADAMDAEFERLEPAVTDGRLSLSEAYVRILRACGTEPGPGLVDSVADKSRELLLASARLYDDVLPFLRTLRSRGVRTAIVSNCDENTRDLLVELGGGGAGRRPGPVV
jgi:FMN phosphatase YigB (HAD superfamily)